MSEPLDQNKLSEILGSTMRPVRGRFGGFGAPALVQEYCKGKEEQELSSIEFHAMTVEQLTQLLDLYTAYLESKKVPAIKDAGKLAHAHWMCQTVRQLPVEQGNRWLGFIQGVLWCEGEFTIDELRSHIRGAVKR